MKKLIGGICLLALAGCSDFVDDNVGTVILFRDANAKKSAVHKIGGYCWVAWYSRIEKLMLHRSGTISDPPFKYRWELDRRGPPDHAADERWFDENCLEPPKERSC